jgi:N-methylhydantoinase A
MGFLVGTDTGGTFTDCVVVGEDGTLRIGKAPSTPDDFGRGVLDSLDNTLDGHGEANESGPASGLEDAHAFLHGATVALNAILTRRGAKVGVLTTRGHRDALFFMRSTGRTAGLSITEVYDYPRTGKPEPIVPKYLIGEIDERVDYKGAVVVALNEATARETIQRLVDEGVEAIAINLLWCFQNPSHEQRLRELVQEIAPDMPVAMASEIVPKSGEYERGATTVMNAYTVPLVSRYIDRLDAGLRDRELASPLLVMQTSGGVLRADEVVHRPVYTLNSGPAGGVIGARYLGSHLGHRNIVCTDVGGTSFDVGLVVDGEPVTTPTVIVNQYRLALPSVDVVSIGAGGGSIARVVGERIKVGPDSAGAVPGPACFDRGGTEPTVTDADVLLGYIDPDYFLAGQHTLRRDLAEQALREKLAEPLGLELHEAAAGVVEIASQHMADLVRKETIGRGHDPRDFVLYAYGGAGPLHATLYGRELGTQALVVPFGGLAPVFSAFGIATADMVHVEELSDPQIGPFDVDRVVDRFEGLARAAQERIVRQGVDAENVSHAYVAEMRYVKQVFEVGVTLDLDELRAGGSEALETAFESAYESLYGKGSGFREAGIELVTLRVTAVGRSHIRPQLPTRPLGDHDASSARRGSRPVYWRQLGGFEETPVYDGELLEPGHRIEGPAMVEERATGIPLHPGQVLEMDEMGNLIISEQD